MFLPPLLEHQSTSPQASTGTVFTRPDRGLLDYTRLMFSSYRAAPHHILIAQKLEAVARGEIKRLMIFTPPRHGKSELVSVRFPAWFLGNNPDLRMIGTSYAATLAERFSGQARNQFNDHRWPYGVALATETKSKASWDISGYRGGYIAAGVGGAITGSGAHVFLIDDPVKNAEDAQSEAKRESTWDWYTSTAYTRLEEDAAIVLVMTRWHEDDLAGRLLAEMKSGGEQWEILSLPAVAEANDALGREPGQALWPEKYNEKQLAGIQRTVGTQTWISLYQQRPTAEEGAMFKRKWFENRPQTYPDGLRWVRYWDLAASTKTSADYTASAAVALDGEGNLWIRDMIRGRWEWPDAKKVMQTTMRAEPHTRHIVEQALHGLAALQDLRRDRTLAAIPMKGVVVDKDKVSRAMAWADRAEAGKVRLVQGPWIAEFLDEVCSFPNAAHDDQVDTVSGGIRDLARSRMLVTQ